MKQYLKLMKYIFKNGVFKQDRTGIGTLSIFGYQMRFNLKEGFPLITTKNLHFRSVIYELLWFLKGETNISFLQKNKVTIWDEWADKNGDLGPIYGKQWRKWEGLHGKEIDQISKVIEEIKRNPDSRRIIVSSWNVSELDKMAIPPCHSFFQFYVSNEELSCQIYQRSCDIFLGLPFNIASYAFLVHMIAHQCDLKVGDLIWTGGDTHLYKTHVVQAKLQLTRKPRSLPNLLLKRKSSSIFNYEFDDFEISGYTPYPSISAPVSV